MGHWAIRYHYPSSHYPTIPLSHYPSSLIPKIISKLYLSLSLQLLRRLLKQRNMHKLENMFVYIWCLNWKQQYSESGRVAFDLPVSEYREVNFYLDLL